MGILIKLNKDKTNGEKIKYDNRTEYKTIEDMNEYEKEYLLEKKAFKYRAITGCVCSALVALTAYVLKEPAIMFCLFLVIVMVIAVGWRN